MEVSYTVESFVQQLFSTVKLKHGKVGLVVFLIAYLVVGLSQSAPTPARRERWNPYYYPTARSLSIPPPRTTTTTATTTTTTTTVPPTRTPRRPQIFRRAVLPHVYADRRASQSLNSTTLRSSMKDSEKNQFKFETGNVTAISHALNDFIKSAEVLVRELLISTQTGMLKVIGQVDQGIGRFQKRLQSTGLRLAFAGQKAASQTYESLPPFVNNIIQRLGTPQGEGRSRTQLVAQLNDAIKNLRELKKMLSDVLDDHEKDFHNVFEDRFTQINQYLGVPGLPRKPVLGWYP